MGPLPQKQPPAYQPGKIQDTIQATIQDILIIRTIPTKILAYKPLWKDLVKCICQEELCLVAAGQNHSFQNFQVEPKELM
jgi:hypothetical protein